MTADPSLPPDSIAEIAARHPDLAITPGMDEQALKQLETKYRLRMEIAGQALRDRELRLKERASEVDRWANPLTVAIIVGGLGLMGTIANGIWTNVNERAKVRNERAAEEYRFQADLIKEAIKPTDEVERAKSLVFFAQNGLIDLDSTTVASLITVAGTDQPVPGSSAGEGTSVFRQANEVSVSPTIIDRIRRSPDVPYPADVELPAAPGPSKIAIILHDAVGPDAAVRILRDGMPNLPGPLAHWAVQTDGTIVQIALEEERASHVGRADRGLTNNNTIGIEVLGAPAFVNEIQLENLVRLVADVANRWGIPSDMILSHAEVAIPAGRKIDMRQQAPVVREMVTAVRQSR